MRLSTDTTIIRTRFGEEEGFRMISEAGFDAVDFSFIGMHDRAEMLGENYAECARRTRAALDKNGLICTQAHAPVPEGVDDFEHTVRYYKSYEPYCQKFGIRIAIENIGTKDEQRGCTVARYGDPETLYKLLKALDSPWFVVCVDVGHAAYGVGPRPEELIEGLDNQILQCLHIHDNDCRHDNHALPFTGNINWDRIMAALKKIDYQGDFSLETVTYLRKFDKELTSPALKFAAVVGRYLINKMI